MIYAAQFSKDCNPPVASEQDVRTWGEADKTCLRKFRMNLLAWSQLVAVAITRSRPDFSPGADRFRQAEVQFPVIFDRYFSVWEVKRHQRRQCLVNTLGFCSAEELDDLCFYV